MSKTVVLFKGRAYSRGSRNDRVKPAHVPLGLLAIASPLIKEGYNVVVFDEKFDENIEKKMLSIKKDIIAVGVSAQTGYELVGGLRISKFAKEVLKVPTIWGGWHASTASQQTAENPYVDFIVKGLGLQTILDLINAIEKRLPLNDIPGIVYKENGKIIENPNRKIVDMNNYPLPAYDIIDLERYIQDGCNKGMGISNDVQDRKNRMLPYTTAYGCPYRCAYCASTSVYGHQITMLKAETVGEQLEYLVKKYDIHSFFFIDSNFFVSVDRVKAICQEIIKRKLNIRFTADPRVDQVIRWDDTVLPLLKEAGCVWLGVGSETGSQRVLDYMKKDIKATDIMKAARKIHKSGIEMTFFFMFGMPKNESKKDLYESFHLAAQLKELFPKILLPMYFFDPYPSTPMYYDALEKGFKEPKSLEEWSKYVPDVIDKNPATVYISDKYVDLVKRVIIFYLPLAYPADMVLGTLTNVRSHMKKGKYKYILRILHFLAKARVKRQFYDLPFEWRLFKLVQKLMPHKIYKK